MSSCCFPNILAFQEGQFTAQSRLSKPTSLVCYAFALYYTSSSSMHICISLELFMLCFVFNTPSCKSTAARHKAVKTALPSSPSHLGWRIYGQVLAPETEAERTLPGPSLKLGTLLFDAPPHFVSFWTCSTPRGDATDSTVWHPFLSTCPVTWSYGSAFHLPTLPSNPSPSLHFKICYPNQR